MPSDAGNDPHFVTTRWSVVLAAGHGDAETAHAALEKLCRTYWFPLYAYVRRRGHQPDEAKDLTQEFFLRLIEKESVRLAKAERGKFRSFLLTSLKHFLINEWEKSRSAKRGGGGEFIGWLSDYGLPTDGLADHLDTDRDLASNWQEWIAGTVPTNSASALRLLAPARDGSGVAVSWLSAGNRTYFLERAGDLGSATSPFSVLSSNIPGKPGMTSFMDTNTTSPGPFIYRVGVQ